MLTRWFKLFRGALFYVLIIVIGGLVMIVPIQRSIALVVLVQFVFGDWERVSTISLQLQVKVSDSYPRYKKLKKSIP